MAKVILAPSHSDVALCCESPESPLWLSALGLSGGSPPGGLSMALYYSLCHGFSAVATLPNSGLHLNTTIVRKLWLWPV